MGSPINRAPLSAAQTNLVNLITSDAPVLEGAIENLYDYVDEKNAEINTHTAATTLPHADGSVTTSKIRDGAVTEQKLATGAVTANKIGTSAVTSDKVAAAAITEHKLATGAVSSRVIANQSVQAQHIDPALFAPYPDTAIWAKFAQVDGRLNDISSVKDYGAKGDGVTNDTQAFTDAIASGKPINIPAGVYLVNTIYFSTSGVKLYSNGGAVIKSINNSSPIFSVSADNINSIQLINFTLDGGTYGIFKETSGIIERCTFDRIVFSNQTIKGIYIKSPARFMVNNLIECVFRYCKGGFHADGGSANLNNMVRCRFEGLDSPSIKIENLSGDSELGATLVNINGCRVEAHDSSITGYSPLEFNSGCMNVNIENIYFEDVLTPCIHVNSFPSITRNMVIKGCHFSGNLPAGTTIKFEPGVRGLLIESNYIATNGGAGTIVGSTTSSEICIIDNQLLGSVSGFDETAYSLNDIGKRYNKDFFLGDHKYLDLLRGGVKFSDVTNTLYVETDGTQGLLIKPDNVSKYLFNRNGDFETLVTGAGIILKKSNGGRVKITVNNSDTLVVTPL